MITENPTMLLGQIMYTATFNLPSGAVSIDSFNHTYIYALIDLAIARGIWFAVTRVEA